MMTPEFEEILRKYQQETGEIPVIKMRPDPERPGELVGELSAPSGATVGEFRVLIANDTDTIPESHAQPLETP